MNDTYRAISNLIAQYARAVDQGDFATLGRLFSKGQVTVGGRDLLLKGSTEISNHWAQVNKSYGTAGLLPTT